MKKKGNQEEDVRKGKLQEKMPAPSHDMGRPLASAAGIRLHTARTQYSYHFG